MSPIRGYSEPATVRDSYTPAQIPELRENVTFPATVVLGEFVRRTIHDDLWTSVRADGRESGGWLFGRPFRHWDSAIEVSHATGRGNAIRDYASVSLDVDEWARANTSWKPMNSTR